MSFDRRLITQAVTNLVKNAERGDRGATARPTAKTDGWRGRIETVVAAMPDRVTIEVIDNGIGLPKQNRTRLLEPYVTTKGHKGTGLGLAIVQKIVEQHGGTLALEDAPDGTRPHARRPDPHHAASGRCARTGAARADQPATAASNAAGARRPDRITTEGATDACRHPDRRRRGRHPRSGRRHPRGRGPPHAPCARQRRGATRDRGAPAAARHPRHLAAGQPPRRPRGALHHQAHAIPTCPSSSSRATATSRRPSPPSSAAPTTTSRSRSRPIG